MFLSIHEWMNQNIDKCLEKGGDTVIYFSFHCNAFQLQLFEINVLKGHNDVMFCVSISCERNV